jgi:hypothetical protein
VCAGRGTPTIPKTAILKLNEDKLKEVQSQYRSLRLTQVEGLAMEQAIGLPVPGKDGIAPYSRADLKYDMQAGLIELIPLDGTCQDGEHVERQPPTEEQSIGPPSETEVKSVEKGHGHVLRSASQLDTPPTQRCSRLSRSWKLEEADAHMACALTMPIWKASASAVDGKAPGVTVEAVPLRKHNPGWSTPFLSEKSLEFNKKYRSMEQLLAYQPWDLCMGFIDAAAAEMVCHSTC